MSDPSCVEVGVDDVEPALDQPAEVGKGHLGLLALGAHGPDLLQRPGVDAVEVRAGQNTVEVIPGAWHHDRSYSSGQGPGPLRPRRGVAVDGPADQRGSRHRAECAGCRCWRPGGRRGTSSVPLAPVDGRHPLDEDALGSLGSRTATTVPGSGQGWGSQGSPSTTSRSPGEQGRGHRRSRPPRPGGPIAQPGRQRPRASATAAGRTGATGPTNPAGGETWAPPVASRSSPPPEPG